jgi:hypothetical protein
METEEQKLPYDKVRKGVVKIIGMTEQKDAATLQYRILLMDSIIRANVDFRKSEAIIIFDERKFKKSELTDVVKPFRMQILFEEELDYAKFVEDTYNIPDSLCS